MKANEHAASERKTTETAPLAPACTVGISSRSPGSLLRITFARSIPRHVGSGDSAACPDRRSLFALPRRYGALCSSVGILFRAERCVTPRPLIIQVGIGGSVVATRPPNLLQILTTK